MPTIFRHSPTAYYTYVDPASDLDYGITCWAESETFASATWTVSPSGSPGPELHDPTINAAPITVDDVEYAIGEVASVWVKQLTAGVTYTVTVRAVLSGGGTDERSFQLIGRER